MDDGAYSYSVPIVVAVIEGSSDEKYLSEPLRAFFKKKYNSSCRLVKIKDITSDPNIAESQFIGDLQSRIEEELSNPENKIDSNVAIMIKEIIHIIDIDECFINSSSIRQDSTKDEFYYTRTGIEFNSINSVVQRNNRKQGRILNLLTVNKLRIFDKDFQYSIFYFSINIDDFHYDDALNISFEEKNNKAALFKRQYLTKSDEGKIKLFSKLFKERNPNDFPVEYNDTWDYIQINNNSLKRCSNAFLIIEKKK